VARRIVAADLPVDRARQHGRLQRQRGDDAAT